MFCPECGSSNPEDALFCQDCGTKLESGTIKTKTSLLSKKKKLIIGETILFIILIIGAVRLGEKKLGAEAVATEYFEQVMNGDWEGAYDNLELEENPFLSKDLFVQVNKGNERKEYTAYKIEYSDSLLDGNGIMKEIQISYRLKGANEVSNKLIKLVKEGKKQLFFFDDWKVVPDTFIAQNYMIQVPKGVKVQLDNVKIDKTYLEDDSQENSSLMDTYRIPELFAGSHEIVLKQENMADVKELIKTDQQAYYIENMPVEKEVKKELVKKAAQDLKNLYIQGLHQAEFSKVKSMFSKDTDSLYALQDDYNNFKSSFQGYDSNSGLRSVFFSDVKGTVTHKYQDGKSVFEVQLEYFYNAKYKTLSWDGTYDESIYDDTGMNTFTYVFEDKKWVIQSFDFNIV